MNFRRGSFREEPEINLVPFIDILIVIVIFLAVTTTYSKYAELKINLPTADANQAEQLPDQIDVAVSSDGQYMINRNRIVFTTNTAFAAELQAASGGNPDPVIVISADANASHQSVISVMEAARMAGFGRITFTTQQTQ
ncbi:MAG: biopolymer transporter ExbD [Betaproteobacteria bacterium]|nr:MAG: biopolymer transporter ExbD [Betaproteobacteria bacterium]